MNTQPLVVPVFAVEEAVKALRFFGQMGELNHQEQQALEVLQEIMKAGPVPMPQGAYDALYGALKAKGIADEAMLKARGVQHQD